jgi:hypothetical protein
MQVSVQFFISAPYLFNLAYSIAKRAILVNRFLWAKSHKKTLDLQGFFVSTFVNNGF